MNRQHLIDLMEFDTAYRFDTVSQELRGDIDTFIQSELVKVIDQVFDNIKHKVNDRDGVLRFDCLELDLGEIDYTDYRQQWPQRLRRELSHALENIRYSESSWTSANTQLEQPANADADTARSALFFFLRHGYLPQSFAVGDIVELDATLQKLLAKEPAALLDMIGSDVPDETILQRIQAQFSATTVSRVTELLKSVGAELVHSVEQSSELEQLFYFLRHGKLARFASIDHGKLEYILHSVISDHPDKLLELVASDDDDAILQTIKVRFSDSSFNRVMQLLVDAFRSGRLEVDPQPARQSQSPSAGVDTLSSVETASGETVAGAEHVVSLHPVDFPAQQEAQLLAALEDQNEHAFDQFWLRFIQQDRRLLTAILHNFGQRQEQRKKLVQRLSRRQFSQLLGVLEPVAIEFLLLVLNHGHWLIPSQSHCAENAGTGDKQLAEYILACLLVERGLHFDKSAFIDSLLHQVFYYGDQSGGDSSLTLTERLGPAEQTGGVSAELANLLQSHTASMAAIAAKITVLHEDYAGYARLADLFESDKPPPSAVQALADIEQLFRQAPWLLQSLWREWQTEGIGLGRVRQHSVQVLQALLDAILALTNHSVAAELSDGTIELAQRIHSHSRHAENKRDYYAEVVFRLINNGVIDFDTIGHVDGNASAGRVDESVSRAAADDSGSNEFSGHKDSLLEKLAAMGHRASRLLQTAELLTTASLLSGLKLTAKQLHASKWRLLEIYTRETGYLYNPQRYIRRHVEHLAEYAGDDVLRFYSALGEALLKNSLPSTRDLTAEIIQQLNDIARAVPDRLTSEVPAQDVTGDANEAPDEVIHLTNAGLVIVAPWLPRLFGQLNYLENRKFASREMAERAVHCLQYLVDGSVDSPEHQLVLNKLLCGVRSGKPIARRIELLDSETDLLDGLLQAITLHWKPLANTSIDGLRESFLQRKGRLQRNADTWQMEVEKRPFDMLLDQLPWSFSTIKFAWMQRVIYVQWR